MSTPSGVGPLKNFRTGPIVTEDPSKATMLNDYFSSVFNVNDGTLPDFARRVSEGVCCDDLTVAPDRI